MTGAKDYTDDFMVEDTPAFGQIQQQMERESDPHRLAQRQKQIDIGKNTLGYQRYRLAVPRDKRNRRTDPVTPNVYQVTSKRAFEGQVKKWKRMLHTWDLPGDVQEGEPALLPVETDLGRASNPAPPAAERSDDFEHISYSDAAASPPSSKNGAALLRPDNRNLPLKIPSAMRKRTYDGEGMAGRENQQPQQQQYQQHPRQHQQQLRAAAGAKQQRLSEEGMETDRRSAAATRPVKAMSAALVSEPSWAEQRYQEPELDYGEESNDAWQHVAAPADMPGQYRTFYNNPTAEEWDEEQIAV
ncbi:Oocyte-specific histone RNA stem-loop-binding 2 [Micractinium conductrix]|uniref:Oocyte-specific histone RNA stem-loop-binding 2 n=1 Tax=Micractinium conductrix TaxID=554055 RepID=A0A2P6VNX3_9CHLO|nr:Oocyte-specific histone RNA stem-loop-binding 2 [Micractinium conductrix]|eukprot:PSC75794.1 Oocyte-specific histone RNA stem-loop-binding 2 [Micractinium conductrix]